MRMSKCFNLMLVNVGLTVNTVLLPATYWQGLSNLTIYQLLFIILKSDKNLIANNETNFCNSVSIFLN